MFRSVGKSDRSHVPELRSGIYSTKILQYPGLRGVDHLGPPSYNR